ncbi:MAG: filamentous hemagglutinin N-terminal domain-containing protein, partial [Candidatus Omnitrophica bacterium]|nr:filamentous hemagglutinin N-terminal domain-containing protein [Candidatus Omnitrophota bacterium]
MKKFPSILILTISALALSVSIFSPHAFCDGDTTPTVSTPKDYLSGIQGLTADTNQVTFRQDGSKVYADVHQDGAIMHCNGFNLSAGETFEFTSAVSGWRVATMVDGTSISNIDGKVTGPVQWFLINPNGIIFGPNATISTAALIASTLRITDAEFIEGCRTGKFRFAGQGAYIYNHGKLMPQPGGYVCLLSQAINNTQTIQAALGKINLASGEMITVALDDASLISVAVDKEVEHVVFGPDGDRIKSAIANSGTISANGGTVTLTAKSLNKVFDYAINNSNVIEAKTLNEMNGEIVLEGSGAPIINTGTIEANTVKISVLDDDFLNYGDVISTLGSTPAPVVAGNIYINALNMLQDGLISADNNVEITVDKLVTTKELKVDTGAVSGDPYGAADLPTAVIRGQEVRINANKIGDASHPIRIDAPLTYIYKNVGDIDISASFGLGTSILILGPPTNDFAIIYLENSDLTLEAGQGSINISSNVAILADNLSLISRTGINSLGSLIISGTLSLLSDGPISSLGVLKADFLYERGASFAIGGTFNVGHADVKNADGAIIIYTTDSLSGILSDPGEIIIETSAIITLTGDTTFWADSDGNGEGRFNMRSGSSIEGQGYNLTIKSSNVSELTSAPANCNIRVINNVHTLTLEESKVGSNPNFIANNDFTVVSFVLNGGTFTAPANLTISGSFTKNGGTFLHNNGKVIFSGTAAGNTITSGGATFYIVRFDGVGGTWILQDAMQVDNLVNVRAGTFDPNGFTVTGNGAANELRIWDTVKVRTSTFGGTFVGFETVTIKPGSTVDYAGTIPQTISNLLTYSNLTLSGSGVKTLAGITVVNGDLNVQSSAILDPNGNTINGAAVSRLINNGTIKVDKTNFTDNYNFTVANIDVSGGTVEYSGTGQNIAGFTYGTLLLDNGGTAQGDITANTLTLAAGTLVMADHSLHVTATLNNSGLITVSTGTILIPNATAGNWTFTDVNTIPAAIYSILTLNNGSATFTAGGNLSAATLDLAAGVLDPNGNTISGVDGSSVLNVNGIIKVDAATFAGNYDFNAANITFGANSTVDYRRTGNQTIANLAYGNLVTSGSGVKTLGDNTTISGNLTIGSGTTFDPNAFTITGNGTTSILNINGTVKVDATTFAGNYANFTIIGFSIPGSSTIDYCRLGNQSIDHFINYQNLTISGSGVKALDGNTAISGDLTVGSGTTFNPNTFTITGNGLTSTLTVNGVILIDAATFAGNYAAFPNVIFSSSSTMTYSGGDQDIAAYTYGNLILAGSGVKKLLGSFSIAGDLTVETTVTLNPNGYKITGSGLSILTVNGTGALKVDGAAFADNYAGFSPINLSAISTVNYCRTGDQAIAALTYGNLTLSGSGIDMLAGAIIINGDLNIGSGVTFDVSTNNYGIDIYGNWVNDGGFNARAGTVTFAGNTTISGSSVNTFNSIIIIGTLTAPSGDIYVSGDWTNNGIFNHSNGKVIFNGSGTQNVNSGGSANPFYIVTHSGTGVLKLVTNTLKIENKLILTNGTLELNGQVFDVNTVDVTAPARIQDALNACNASGVINVGTGTYSENLIIGKAVTMTAMTAATPVLQGSGIGSGITINVDNVTISGLAIKSYDIGIDLAGAFTNVNINHDIFDSNVTYHLRSPAAYSGATIFDIYKNNNNAFLADGAVIVDINNISNVVEAPTGYKAIFTSWLQAMNNLPVGGAVYHIGAITNFSITTTGAAVYLINKGDVYVTGTGVVTNGGKITIIVIDPDLFVNAPINSGGADVFLSATGSIINNFNGYVITGGGKFTGIADSDHDGIGIFNFQPSAYSGICIDTTIGATGGQVEIVGSGIFITGTVNTGDADIYLSPSKSMTVGLGTGAGLFKITNVLVSNLNTIGRIIIGMSDYYATTYAGNITAADFSAPGRTIVLYTTGSINGQGATTNITADRLDMYAVTGIGSATPVVTAVQAMLAHNSTSGNIGINNTYSGTVTVNGIENQDAGGLDAGGYITFNNTGGILNIDGAVTNADAGAITITNNGGAVNVNAPVTITTALPLTGNENISITASSPLNINASVSAPGNITLQATEDGGNDDDITINAAILSSGAGQIWLKAGHDIKFTGTGDVSTVGGTAILNADYDGSGLGAIIDNTPAENTLITATNATLTASTGIGALGAADIDTNINNLQATNNVSGDIYIQEVNGLVIMGTGVRTLGGDGNINIDVDAGALTVNSVVTADGDGNITLNADSGLITINAVVSSTSGDILITGDAIDQNSDITTGDVGANIGTITLIADAGDITMADLTTAQAGSGLITYTATGNVALSLLTTTGNVNVTADSDNVGGGAITDNTALENPNIVADTATLIAGTGIGALGAADIDTNINNLQATNNVSGDIYIQEVNGLVIMGTG